MGIALCDQLSGLQLGGAAVAGVGGASAEMRAVEIHGSVRRNRFSFTIPASGNGSANGDQIKLTGLKVTDRIYAIRILNPALGAGVTLAAGKLDTNNAANNDNNHYLVPTPANNPGIIDANINLSEQVGVDPTGATTDTGDAPPNYGNKDVHPILTIGGGAPTTGAIILGWVDFMGDAS